MSVVLSNAARLKPEIRLAQAVSQFEADLSSEQKATFRTYRSQSRDSPPDVSDVMRLTAEIDRPAAGKTGARRCFGPRLTSFLQSVQQFAALGDIIIGGSQNLIACGVWSLVRMSLLLIVNFSTYLEKLSSFLMVVGRSAPRYQMMALLYPQSRNLQSYVPEYFIVVTRLCHQLLKFTQQSTLGQFASSLSDSDTKAYQSELDLWANAIKDEVSLLMAKTIEQEAQANSKFRSLSSKLSESVSLRQKLKANLRVLDSCSTYDYETTWKQTRKIGNSTLFNRIAEYHDWKGQETSCTLIWTGKLGSGKSVLLANLIDDLNLDDQSKSATVAYFFCRYDVPESFKARTILGSLARQLLRRMANLAMTRFIDETTTLAMDFKELLSFLQRVLPTKSKAYFILDGLDECDSAEQEIVIQELQVLQHTFSLLLGISIRLGTHSVLKFSLEMLSAVKVTSIPDDNPDIEAFISAELESRILSEKLVIGNPALILEIQDALLEGSHGMFLWVALQIESLCDMKTDHAIYQALADLPKDLSETFSRILQKSEVSGQPYQRRILELVTVALRPLTAEELRDALSVVAGDAVWNPSRLLNDIYLILTCCGSLLTVDEEEMTIRLVHQSVKQFIFDGFKDSANIAVTVNSANKTIGDIIVTYLNYGVFGTQLSTVVVPQIMTTSAPSQIVRSTLNSSSNVQSLALKFLKSKKQPDFDMRKTIAETRELFSLRSVDEFSFYSYAKLYWLQHIFCVPEQEPAMYDLLLRLFKKNVVNTNVRDGNGRTPLSLAARNGYEAVVKLLLDANTVDIDSKDNNGRTPLFWAARNGHEAVVKLLLDRGAELLDSKDNNDCKPLFWAARNGHEAVVKLLLDRGAELLDSKDNNGCTPLFWAARNGHEAVVELLLDRGSELLDSVDENGYTALFWTALNGHKAAVKLLLDMGAELECVDNHGKTPLQSAALAGHRAVVELLLDRGANLESKDNSGQTSLFRAAGQGHQAVVKLLLDRGAKLESEDNYGRTPLTWTVGNGQEAVVKLLLDRSADLGSKSYYEIPLLAAATKGDKAVVELLLDRNADLESSDINGRTPLIWAIINGHMAVVKLLLDRGAKTDYKDNDGRTPLSWAVENRHEALVTLLTPIT